MRVKFLLATAVAAVLVGGALLGRILGVSRIQGYYYFGDEVAKKDGAVRGEESALHMRQGQTTKRAVPAATVVEQQEQQHVPGEEAGAAGLRAGRPSVGGDYHADETKGLDGGAAGTRDSSRSSSSSRAGTTEGEKEGSAPTSEGGRSSDPESRQGEEAGGKAQVPLAMPHAGVLESVMSTYKDISEEILVRSLRRKTLCHTLGNYYQVRYLVLYFGIL